MPELPEVQTVVASLEPKVIGRTIVRVEHARQDIITPADADLPRLLRGRRIESVGRRGKRIVFTLDDGNRFYIHLGMTGQLTVVSSQTAPASHTHLQIDLGNGRRLRFRDPRRFGGVWWLGRDSLPDAGMGPEPLKVRPAQLFRRLHKTTRAVKNALMDQRLIAGLGNIYVDESLFAAGIHPLEPANELSPKDIARLNRAIKATLRRAIRHRGSTLRDYMDSDGGSGAYQKLHRVYDRKGQPCRRCRTPIERIVLGGRSTHFCPRCQPRRATGAGRAR